MPVTSASETLEEYVVLGRVPSRPGEQVAHTVRVERALHYAEVGGARIAARHLLNGDSVAHGLYSANQSNHDEGGQ